MNILELLDTESNKELLKYFFSFLDSTIPDEVKTNFTKLWRSEVESNKEIDLKNVVEYYKKEKHQIEALEYLNSWLNENYGRMYQYKEYYNNIKKRYEINNIPKQAIDLIKKWEGFKSEAYICPNGVTTIGYGSTRWLDGTPVKINEKINEKEAEILLIKQLENEFMPRLVEIPYWLEMNDEMKSALISFAYNLGANFYHGMGFDTITYALSNKIWSKIPNILEMYRNPGSKFEAGLLNRRRDEGKLWSKGLKKVKVKYL